MKEEFLTLDEIAQGLKMKREALQAHCRTGRLKAVKVGRRYLVTEEALMDFINHPTA